MAARSTRGSKKRSPSGATSRDGKPTRSGGSRGVSFATVRELALKLPDVEETTSWGTAAFKVRRGKLLARLREDGETLVVACEMDDRELLVSVEPEVFFFTDHYRNYPYVLVRLAVVRKEQLADVLEQAWTLATPKRLVAARSR